MLCLVGLLVLLTDVTTITADAVGLWPLNAQYGASDATGGGNDGVARGTQLAPGPNGDANGAFLFSGTANSYIDIPNNGRLDVQSSYTILAHIYPTGAAGPIFNYVGNPWPGQWAVHFWQTSPQALFMRTVGRDGQSAPHVASDVLQQNAWNYVGGTYDISTGLASIWWDGEVVGRVQIGVRTVASQFPVRVAAREGDSSYFAGRIACLQLYDYAMAQEQIVAARDKCVDGADAVGLWPLNAQYGASDTTGGGNDGVARGTQLAPGPNGDANGAFLFSGTANSYIDIPNNGRLDVQSSYTILAHIYPTGAAGPIFNYVGNLWPSQWAVHFWQTSPQALFMRTMGRDGQSTPHVASDVLQQNAWNYVGGTYDISTGLASIWWDGEVVGRVQIGVRTVASQFPVRVAAREGDSSYFAGRIACLQLYDYAMAQEQIVAARDKCGDGATATTEAATTTTTPAVTTTTPSDTTTTPAVTTTTPAATTTTPAATTTTPAATTTTPAVTATMPTTSTVITTRESHDAATVTPTRSSIMTSTKPGEASIKTTMTSYNTITMTNGTSGYDVPEGLASPPPTASRTISRLGEGGSAAANTGEAPGGKVAGGVVGAIAIAGAGVAVGGYLLYKKKKKVSVEPTP
ncbi:Hypp7076 [Branchiostoma lanceolatum]|uniref:Hypp7076 protein n=1 Tax=Branchiostoma lanceolatum TaxID=7740 RepID=A0A8K0E905_BRALA|nr:Hypp7076 [Branchiostoma lanceolatum]